MWNTASPTGSAFAFLRSVLAFLMAAAVAFVGSAMLLKAGRAFPELTGGAGGQPGMLLLAVVILLAVVGALLVAMAGKEFLDHRHRIRTR